MTTRHRTFSPAFAERPRVYRNKERRLQRRLVACEFLEDRRMFSVDLGFRVPQQLDAESGSVKTSLIDAYNPATGEETTFQGSLSSDFPAAEQAAREAGFDGLQDLLHKITHEPGASGGVTDFIFGSDDRTLVTNTLAWPYSAIGRLWMNFGGSEASCSGVMIDAYHVLTAGHCVNGVNGGGWANQIVFSAAQDGTAIGSSFRRSNDQYYGEANWTFARSYVEWTQNDNWDWDVAVVTLDRRIGNFTGWYGYGYNSDNNFYSGHTAFTAGYPGDLTPSAYDMWTDTGNAVNYGVTSNQLRTTDIDIWPGQSGSPIAYSQVAHGVVSHQTWNDTNGNGVFDNGETPLYNAFTRITSPTYTDIGNWINEDNGVRQPTDRPDFVDYDQWFNTNFAFMNSTFVVPGGNFSVTAYPRNNGTAASGNYSVSFYASTNNVISTFDYFLGSVNLGSLPAFNWSTATLNTAFPGTVPTGSYYVGWIIDSTGANAEFDESNNTGLISNTLLTVGADDHGNGSATATRIYANSTTSGNLEVGGDTDWFLFEASAGVQVTLATTLGTLADSTLTLYAADGVTELAFDDDGGPGLASLLTYTTLNQGTFYVKVAEYGNNDPGTYTLTLSNPDDYGNGPASAGFISSNSILSGNLEVGGDTDWFYFFGAAGTQLTLETSLLTQGDSILRLYDSDGVTELAFDDDGGVGLASRIDFTLPHDGVFYVEESDFGTPNPGTYTLSLTHADDHGNSALAATGVAANGVPTAGTVEISQDLDFFSFAAIAGVEYTLQATLGTLSDTTLTLYDTDGTTLLEYNDDSGGTLASQIVWTAPASGTYFAQVTGFSILAGTYDLTISAPPTVDGDFNDDGLYDLLDIDALVAAIAAGTQNPAFDLTGDGMLDLADRDAWLAEAGSVNLPSGNPYLVGDSNLDGVVDGQDFIAWNGHKFQQSARWSEGDFNADGVVDGQDFILWNGNKFMAASRTAGVPGRDQDELRDRNRRVKDRVGIQNIASLEL